MPIYLRDGKLLQLDRRRSDYVVAINTLSTATTLGSGICAGNQLDNFLALGTRYWTDLSTQRTVRLSERALVDAYGAYKPDEDKNVRIQLGLDYLPGQAVINSSFIHWVIQEAAPDADIHTWGGTRNILVNNQYTPNPARVFVTPLHVHHITGIKDAAYEGYQLSTLPQSFLDLFNLGNDYVTSANEILPATWTLHRTWPEIQEMTAENRRWITGTAYFWGDDDGPVSFLPQQAFDSLTKAILDTPVHILEVIDPAKPNSNEGFRFYKGKFRDLGTPGRFGLVNRKLAMTNTARGLDFYNEKIIQLIHFGPTFKDIWTKPENAKLLTFFKQLFRLNQVAAGNIWLQHPTLIAGLEALNFADQNLIGKIGPRAARTVMGCAAQLATLDGIFKTREIPFIGKAEMDALQLPRVLGRTERGRAYQRAQAAAFTAETRRDEENKLLETAIGQRNSVLLRRKEIEGQLRSLRAQVQLLEQDLKTCNTTVKVHTSKVERANGDLGYLQKRMRAAEVTADQIMEELGGTVPNLFRTWIRQNWLILDLKYKHKVTGRETSLREDSTLSSNPNYTLSYIKCRTILPNIIRVGAKNDPEWEKNYGKRVGGPYLFEVRPNKVVIRPAERYTIMGVHPDYRGLTTMQMKLHPHTKALNYTLQDPGHCRAWFLGQGDDGYGICLGEATVALHQCFQQQDLNIFLLTLNSWVSNADPYDDWGAQATWFPRPEEVPLVTHNYSFEEQTRIYTMRTGQDNHLFYELQWRDGISGLKIRHGSMVKVGETWTVPSARGRTTMLDIPAASIEAEVTTRVAALQKRGYRSPEQVNATQVITEQLQALPQETPTELLQAPV